jgi:hypothetical protein
MYEFVKWGEMKEFMEVIDGKDDEVGDDDNFG